MNLNISRAQYNKLKKGLPVQLKHEHLGAGMHFGHLREKTKKKLQSAYNKQKGLRITLEPDELVSDSDDDDDDVAESDVDEAIGGTLFGKHGKSNKLLKKIGVKKEANKLYNVLKKEVLDVTKPAYYEAKNNAKNQLNQYASQGNPGTQTGGTLFGKHGKTNKLLKKIGVKKEANKLYNVLKKEVLDVTKPAYYVAKNNAKNQLTQYASQGNPSVTTGSGFRTFQDGRSIARPHTSNTQWSVKANAPFNSGFNSKIVKGGSMRTAEHHTCPHCGSVTGGSFKPNGGSFIAN